MRKESGRKGDVYGEETVTSFELDFAHTERQCGAGRRALGLSPRCCGSQCSSLPH